MSPLLEWPEALAAEASETTIGAVDSAGAAAFAGPLEEPAVAAAAAEESDVTKPRQSSTKPCETLTLSRTAVHVIVCFQPLLGSMLRYILGILFFIPLWWLS